MVTENELKPLGSVAKVRSGYAFKSRDMGDAGEPIIKIKNIAPPRIKTSDCQRIPKSIIEKVANYQRYALSEGDILIAMTGATVGKVGRLQTTTETYYLNQRVGKVYLTDRNSADYNYIYYVLSQDIYVRQMFGVADGSAQANISGAQIEKLNVPLPPLSEQKAIASILGSLDDKIELNRRMNETLESMARAIFKSWFVDFDPVRAKMDGRQPAGMDQATADLFPDAFETVDGELVPKGWEVVKITDLADVNYGNQLPQKKLLASGYPVYGAAGVVGYYSNAMFKDPVTLVTSRGSGSGTVHQTFGPSFVTNNSFTVVPKSDSVGRHYLRHALNNADIKSLATGSAQPQLTIANFSFLCLVRPHKQITSHFDKVVHSLWTKVNSQLDQSTTLANLRDTLLPKLLSGELRVKDAEKAVSSAL